jgi:hypothetical protein
MNMNLENAPEEEAPPKSLTFTESDTTFVQSAVDKGWKMTNPEASPSLNVKVAKIEIARMHAYRSALKFELTLLRIPTFDGRNVELLPRVRTYRRLVRRITEWLAACQSSSGESLPSFETEEVEVAKEKPAAECEPAGSTLVPKSIRKLLRSWSEQ